jgi:hypothetical protein
MDFVTMGEIKCGRKTRLGLSGMGIETIFAQVSCSNLEISLVW